MVRCPVPVIAAVNGPAVGLGCSLALLSDLVLMAEGTYLADPHVQVGVVAGDGGAMVLPLIVGLARAKELLFLGDRVSAEEAVQLGLANRVVPGDNCSTRRWTSPAGWPRCPPGRCEVPNRR